MTSRGVRGQAARYGDKLNPTHTKTSVKMLPRLLLAAEDHSARPPSQDPGFYLCGLRNQLPNQSQVLSDRLGLFLYVILISEDEALRI